MNSVCSCFWGRWSHSVPFQKKALVLLVTPFGVWKWKQNFTKLFRNRTSREVRCYPAGFCCGLHSVPPCHQVHTSACEKTGFAGFRLVHSLDVFAKSFLTFHLYFLPFLPFSCIPSPFFLVCICWHENLFFFDFLRCCLACMYVAACQVKFPSAVCLLILPCPGLLHRSPDFVSPLAVCLNSNSLDIVFHFPLVFSAHLSFIPLTGALKLPPSSSLVNKHYHFVTEPFLSLFSWMLSFLF